MSMKDRIIKKGLNTCKKKSNNYLKRQEISIDI